MKTYIDKQGITCEILSTRRNLQHGTQGNCIDALIYRESAVEPFVVAFDYDEETRTWSYGHYFRENRHRNEMVRRFDNYII